MKKILSILMILVLLGGFAFAQEEAAPAKKEAPASVAVDKAKKADFATTAGGLSTVVTGSASVTWGIDLVAKTHGFKNATSAFVIIPFFGGKADGVTGEAPVFAEISAATRSVGGAKVNAASITLAKLHFYGAYIDVLKPGFGINFANMFQPVIEVNGHGALFAPSFSGQGLTIGYANADLMGLNVGLKFASNGPWDDYGTPADPTTTPPTPAVPGKNSQYGMGIDFGMAYEKLVGVDLGWNMTFNHPRYTTGAATGSGIYTNFGIGLSSSPVEGLKIGLGFDGEYDSTKVAPAKNFAYDFALTASYRWIDMSFNWVNKGTGNLNMHFGFDSKDLVDGLKASFKFNMFDLTNISAATYKTLPMGIGLKVAYTYGFAEVMSITPHMGMYMETNNGAANDFAMAYDIGLDFVPVPHATVSINWEHGATNADKYSGKYLGENMISSNILATGGGAKLLTLGLKLDF